MNNLYCKLIVLLLFFGTTTISFTQTVEYFKEYDYKDEITINGARGEETIYIPVKENIDALNSFINLEFTCSNVLNFDKSIISILISDIPFETRFLKDENQKIKIKIPIKRKYIVSDYIKVTVKTNLRIDTEICEIYSKGGFWIKITENSFFSYKLLDVTENFVTKTISYVVPEIKNIVLSDSLNLEDVKYASYIKFYLKRVYGLDIAIKKTSDYKDQVIKDAVILMPYNSLNKKIKDKLPKKDLENKGLVSIYNDEYVDAEKEKTYQGSNIVVTGQTDSGYKKAALYLLQKHLLNSSYIDYVYVNEEAKLSDIPKRKDYEPIYFNELDAENGILQGTGYLQSNISMPRSNFGSNVKNIEVNLTGRYRPLQKDEQGFFNLYFNDNFLSSYKLDNTGELNINFSFDDIVMQQNNNFRYEFYFVPIGGLCDISSANFYGQIDVTNSSFKPIGYDVSSSLSFFRFPENFQSKPLTIYTDLDVSTKMVSTLSELVDIMNPGEIGLSGFIYPDLIKATIDTIKDDKETSKIIISSNYDKYSDFFGAAPFLKFNNNAVEFKAEEIQPFFNLEYQHTMGFNQLFYFDGSPVMLINIPEDFNENTLLSLVSNIREQKISDTGNVIISNKDNAYFFDLRAIESNNDKGYISNLFNNFWDKYRLLIVSILLILFILLLIFIFQKSKESKDKIQNAK
jgi:hypothetical protein